MNRAGEHRSFWKSPVPMVFRVWSAYRTNTTCWTGNTTLIWLNCRPMRHVGLLAFSPLAAGILSGKYQGDRTPPGSRRNFSKDLGGRYTPQVIPVIDEYLRVAKKHGLDCCQMAIAFCLSRQFMASAIIGATKPDQLEVCIAASEVNLSREVLEDIAEVHRNSPNPMG